jgi:hypothetical protein
MVSFEKEEGVFPGLGRWFWVFQVNGFFFEGVD